MESNCSHTALKRYESGSENKVTRDIFWILCDQLYEAQFRLNFITAVPLIFHMFVATVRHLAHSETSFSVL